MFEIVATLVGIGIVVGATLLAVRVRSRSSVARREGEDAAFGLAVGTLLGAALGLIVWMSTGTFMLWVIMMAAGMASGLALGTPSGERGR